MQNKFTPNELVNLWNFLVYGKYRKVRLIEAFLNDKKIKVEIAKALKSMPEKSMWETAIRQALKNFEGEDSGFWWGRKGKDGLSWFLQRRSKGQGEYNYLYYYETGLELEEDNNKVEDLFTFTETTELP